MASKPKLELTWIGKENRPKLEPRILLEDPAKSYHAKYRFKEASRGDAESAENPSASSASPRDTHPGDLFDNRLIFGDNLLALKALEQEFAGKVKCIYIDPPYNTGSAFTHFDDGIEHSLWLSLMRDRLELLRRLLAEDGSIWVNLDDNEGHYCKVLMDEVFGRNNFITTVVWQKKYTQANDAVFFSDNHDLILVYGRNKEIFHLGGLPRTEAQNKAYRNPDNDPRGPWKATPLHAKSGAGSGFSFSFRNGVIWRPPAGTFPRFSEASLRRMDENNEIWFGRDGKATPSRKTFLSSVGNSVNPKSIWLHDEVGHNHEARTEAKAFMSEDPFGTPKPERLIHRIIMLATNPGDLVLDSFAGSGTTGAVAHKMGRRWIMVELGEHSHTHIIPRMKKVVDGEDPGGITKAVNWKGGGGFRYYRLAPSLLEKDKWGNWVINKEYNAAMLAEALCKIEGFTYAPSDSIYWMHGHSTERDYIYVTTQNLNHDPLQALSDEVGSSRSLLVLCSAFRGKADRYPNLTIKKIPNTVLKRCEWGHDDYSLQVENLPKAPPPKGQQELELV